MRGGLRCFRWVLCAALAALAPVCLAQTAQVRDIDVSATTTGTRAVIELSGPVKYKLFQLARPGRVVLDIDAATLGKGFDAPHDSGLVKDVRTGHHGKHGVRVVLDLAGEAHPRSFLLEPADGHGYRLVVDLYRNLVAATRGERQAAVHAAKLLNSARKIVIAVDAGHGGVDPGAHGPHGTLEKNVTLKVAKDLAALIDKQPGMTAVLTRKDDEFVPLRRRYEIARKHNADLFISIHADAWKNGDAKGSSVWVLSTHGRVSEAARWLANRQNHADLLGGVSLDDKSDSLASVLLDLQQRYAIHASSLIAGNVLHALAKIGPTHRDHVERANFVVLRSPDVPSILVETAFITNPEGERNLRKSSYREKIAQAVLSGVEKYYETTPPPGTWFALQAQRRAGKGVQVAVADASDAPDAPDPDPVIDSYRVSPGDTLSGIAQHYGVSISAIKSANGMNDDAIRSGTVLRIPAS